MSGTQDRGRGRGRGRGGDRGGGRGRGGDRGDFSLPLHPGGRGRGGYSSDYGDRGGYGRGDYGRGDYGDRGRGRGRGDRGRGDRGGFGRGRGGPTEVQVFSRDDGGSATLDSQVTRTEGETEKAIVLAARQKQSTNSVVPLRPGFGTQGRTILLWTNHLHLMINNDLVLYRYSIDIVPDQVNRPPTGKKMRRIVQLLVEDHFSQYQVATDFKSNMISQAKIPLDNEGYPVRYRTEEEDEPDENAKVYRARVQATGSLTASELTNYLASANLGSPLGSKEEIIQALNIVLGHHPKSSLNIASVGANKHFQLAGPGSEKFELGAGLSALRGFFVSVRAATNRILVNVQVKHAALYDDGPLEGLMRAYMAENGPSRVKLGNFLKRVSVNVTHIVRQNKQGRTIPRIKVIKGLATRDDGRGQPHPPTVSDFGAGPRDVKFFMENQDQAPDSGEKSKGSKGKKTPKAGPDPPSEGRYVSVFEFFQRTYGITIRDPSLPVINVGTKQNPSYLPPEVCVVQPGQQSNSKLSPGQTQKMIRLAVRKPAQNAQSIVTSGVRMLGFDPPNSRLNAFGINVQPGLLAVPGRVLNSPDVKYGGGKVANTRFGSWNMQSVQFSTRVDLPYWTYLWISTQGSRDPWRDNMGLKSSIDGFTAMLRQVGINAVDCVPGLRINVTPQNLEAEIDNAVHRFASNQNPPKFILVILPSADVAIYNRVKYACDVKEGLLNVCVVGQKFAKDNNLQYFANVALKVNLKLGGRNQFLDNPKLGILSEGKTMVVGIDVTHPSPGSSSNAPSVAGIVASVDRWLAQWPADIRVQERRQEMVLDLDNLFKSRLRLWMQHNGTYPQNILVYRDGVSEGQYELVLEKEFPALCRACEELYPASSTKQGFPRKTIIIVGKRHNTRFYPTRQEEADRSSNPQNGTVVDRGVTEARHWDFFLQAHTALQGTARPAHYFIVHDEIFRNQNQKVPAPFQNPSDVLEDLTHNLCYLFGRATKAVSVCPPAYYADLVCERARCYLSGLFDPTPATSPAMSEAGGPPTVEADPGMVRIHDQVRNAMFYI